MLVRHIDGRGNSPWSYGGLFLGPGEIHSAGGGSYQGIIRGYERLIGVGYDWAGGILVQGGVNECMVGRTMLECSCFDNEIKEGNLEYRIVA